MPDLSILKPHNGKPPIAERVKPAFNDDGRTLAFVGDNGQTWVCIGGLRLPANIEAAIVECAVREWMLSEATKCDSVQYWPGEVLVEYPDEYGSSSNLFDSITAAAHWVADREGL